ncbi:MAG: hypothetical protein ACLFWF_00650 [Alphaproteobacteria bacterium]
MRGAVINLGLAAIIALTMLAYELGLLAPADAFFGAAAPLIFYTGYQFAKREGMALGDALADIFARPPVQPRRRAFHFAYLISAVLGLVVMIQTLAQA